jgi:hypothetical protein
MEMSNTYQITNNQLLKPAKLSSRVAGKLLLALTVIAITESSAALAQFVTPLLPAPGSGSIPKPEIAGDNLPSPAVSSGKADSAPTQGTNLAHAVNLGRTTVYIYSNCTRGANDLMSGSHLVLTLRPATLASKQLDAISTILKTDLTSGQAAIQVNATTQQLESIQSVLNPSASDVSLGLATITQNNTKRIDKAPTGEQWSQLRRSGDDSLIIDPDILPTVRICARYFVMAAVALSTVYMIFAASSIIFGQAHGGPRVIATCAGLILLLMGYTIYKVALTNLFHASGTIKQNVDVIRYFSNQGQISANNQ